MAATSEWAGQKSFRNSLWNSSQSRNFEYPPFFSSHRKICSAHLAARPDFIYDKAQVIFVCSSGKESGHSWMYVWQEVRNACPWDRSPLYSLGKARGGGHPIGADQRGGMLVEEIFGEVGGGCSFCMRASNCRKPFKIDASCFWVLISLASESIRACSTAARQSSGEGASCCVGSMLERTEGESGRRNAWSKYGSEGRSGPGSFSEQFRSRVGSAL